MITRRLRHLGLVALTALSIGPLAACERASSPSISAPAASPEARSPSPSSASEAAASKSAPASPETASAKSDPATSTAPRKGAMTAEAFSQLVRRLSEPDSSFFSDNTISNETSYLQVASQIADRARIGGAYIGVGPEQNFSYIALARPDLAFIVDIRRQNMLQHLLYKALFEEATSRPHFLALLLGRPFDKASDPGATAGIAAVLAAAEKNPADEREFSATHARLRERIERAYGVHLDTNDKKNLEVTHRSFLKGQLELRFELHKPNGRLYPTLRDLLKTTSETGAEPSATPEAQARGSFLATEESFRFLKTMHAEHRIIPVVGDFAGDRAMPGVAAHLKEQGIPVSFFYVSNVEQYLFEPAVWPKWSRNVAALPIDEKSFFIRAYLDQGRRHPAQMKGHRTATVLQPIAAFNARQQKKPYESFWSVSTDGSSESSSSR
jgi:hypothetical protein